MENREIKHLSGDEGFLTHDDFPNGITDEELEKINGHPLGDGDKRDIDLNKEPKSKPVQPQHNPLYDEELAGYLPDGCPIYKSDDPGKIYKLTHIKENKSLLEQTPEKDKRYLDLRTVVEGNYEGKFRKGYLDKEGIVKRVLDENNNWLTNKKGLNKYMALTTVNFSYQPDNGKARVHFEFKPGDTFYSSRNGENLKKRKEMISKAV